MQGSLKLSHPDFTREAATALAGLHLKAAQRQWLGLAPVLPLHSPSTLVPPAHPPWPAVSTLTTARAPNYPSTPPVNTSHQHSHCLIQVQGFNRSLKKKKKTVKLLQPRAQPPGLLPLVHGRAGPGPPRPGRPGVPAYSRRTPAASGAGILSCI